MPIPDGTFPHYVKVQMGSAPNPLTDGQACIPVPLDETPEGVARQLAGMARLISTASINRGGVAGPGAVTSVDGAPCSIPIQTPSPTSGEDGFALQLSKLVAPKGWRG